jgi:hypothetical protein
MLYSLAALALLFGAILLGMQIVVAAICVVLALCEALIDWLARRP